MAIEKLPEDIGTERNLLSTLCAPGAESAALECSAALRLDDFVHPVHRAIYKALGTVLAANSEVSLSTLKDALSRAGDLGRVGDYTGLTEILGGEEVGRPMVLVEILQRHRRLRELIRLGSGLVRKAQEGTAAPEALTEEAGCELARIAMRQDHSRIRHISDVSDTALAGLADEMNGIQGARSWVKGWTRVNRMLGGFHPGQLIVLAARPGVGKTALALNWLLGVTAYQQAVGVFSLEMQADRIWRRLVAAHAGLNLRSMVESKDLKVFRALAQAKAELDARGIWIQDRSSITPREIMGEVDGLLARQPLGLLVVDHLSLVSTPETARSSRQTDASRIGDISRAFKLLAMDRKIPVLLLAQLNREVEHRQGGRPQLSDLRDSGAIEQDADVVLFIHRTAKPGEDSREASLIVAKQREGPTGEIPLEWDGDLTRFTETERSTAAPTWEDPQEFV